MGRTLPSITQEFIQEQEAFARFRRALRRADPQTLITPATMSMNTASRWKTNARCW